MASWELKRKKVWYNFLFFVKKSFLWRMNTIYRESARKYLLHQTERLKMMGQPTHWWSQAIFSSRGHLKKLDSWCIVNFRKWKKLQPENLFCNLSHFTQFWQQMCNWHFEQNIDTFFFYWDPFWWIISFLIWLVFKWTTI